MGKHLARVGVVIPVHYIYIYIYLDRYRYTLYIHTYIYTYIIIKLHYVLTIPQHENSGYFLDLVQSFKLKSFKVVTSIA